jgi:hypothetical protein
MLAGILWHKFERAAFFFAAISKLKRREQVSTALAGGFFHFFF